MAERLRILHLVEKNRMTTGSVVQMFEAARGLAGRGHWVAVGSRPGGDLEESCKEAGIRFFGLPLSGPVDLGSALRLRRILTRSAVEVVHVHKGIAHAVALAAATGLGRLPVVIVNRGVTFALDRFNKWKYRHPRVVAVVCVGAAVRDVVLRTGGVPPDRAVVIRAGTDTARFDPGRLDRGAVRSALGIGTDELVVGQVSVRDWKGWLDLIAAWPEVRAAERRARLMLIGCEQPLKVLKEVAARLSDSDAHSVEALPFRRDMPEILGSCDVVVDASWAGTGITGSIREAMAMARPVVVTECGGNTELVADGETGYVVPPRHPAAFAAAAIRLLADAELRTRFGAAGRRRVVARFTTERRIDELGSLYRRVTRFANERGGC